MTSPELVAHMWGACVPTDCDWGTESISIYDSGDGILELVWDQGFVIRTQQLEVLDDGRLMITTHSHYIDDSGRPDMNMTNYFVK